MKRKRKKLYYVEDSDEGYEDKKLGRREFHVRAAVTEKDLPLKVGRGSSGAYAGASRKTTLSQMFLNFHFSGKRLCQNDVQPSVQMLFT